MMILWQTNARDCAVYDISSLISRQVLCDFMFCNQIRRSPGLYSFWLRGRCLYVGMSDDLQRRILQHTHNETNPELAKYFDVYKNEIKISLAYLSCTKAELLNRERYAIDQLRPIANRTRPCT